MPFHFESDTEIEGISATDIFTLNTALGATIEEQVVAALNKQRKQWDPDGQYSQYGFVRQTQCFPDVLLRKRTLGCNDDLPLMGIELKGWYLLSKEGEPSSRFRVTPSACAPADLLVVIPWVLKNVLSGRPKVFTPFVTQAAHAAQMRNYYWAHARATEDSRDVVPPAGAVNPYPRKRDKIADRALSDAGGNFGRFSRAGIMDDYLAAMLQERVCGIPAKAWLEYFKVFTDTASQTELPERINRLRRSFADVAATEPPESLSAFAEIVGIIEASLGVNERPGRNSRGA